jgi:carboxyl-terminal processing protease
LIELDVPRDEINIPTIAAAVMLDDRTAYIRLQDFAEQTGNDLAAALQRLSANGMRRLLLDLRGNPGGPLDQAIRVSNEFLPRGEMIVYTRGRVPNSDQDYRATERGRYLDVPLVVLANRNSASASEIVAGALQDHDRAVIVGETTFGKALVQSVYRISEGAALALTTARYYTPSGRMIQRPWDGTFDEYLTYAARAQNAPREHAAADLKYTDGGRKVYSGGGIEPDHRLEGPVEGFNPGRFARLLFARQAFASFAQKFSALGDTRIAAEGKGRMFVAKDFTVDAAMLGAFRDHLAAERVTIDEAAFTQDLAFITAMIRYEIDLNLWTVEDARRHLITIDPQAQLALTCFDEAGRLVQAAKGRASRGNQ